MTSELDLEQLEKVARVATDGPWSVVDGDEVTSAEGPLLAGLPTGDAIVCWMPDATHIATFDPPTVLALIARLREAEAKVERVEAIHLRMRVVLYPGAGERVIEVCTECRTRSGDLRPWPCPTMRALEEA